jgi:hypothetical protein
MWIGKYNNTIPQNNFLSSPVTSLWHKKLKLYKQVWYNYIRYARNKTCSGEDQSVRIMARKAEYWTDCRKFSWNVQCGVRQFLNTSIECQWSVIWSYIFHNNFTLFQKKRQYLWCSRRRTGWNWDLNFVTFFYKCRFISLLCCYCIVALWAVVYRKCWD